MEKKTNNATKKTTEKPTKKTTEKTTKNTTKNTAKNTIKKNTTKTNTTKNNNRCTAMTHNAKRCQRTGSFDPKTKTICCFQHGSAYNYTQLLRQTPNYNQDHLNEIYSYVARDIVCVCKLINQHLETSRVDGSNTLYWPLIFENVIFDYEELVPFIYIRVIIQVNQIDVWVHHALYGDRYQFRIDFSDATSVDKVISKIKQQQNTKKLGKTMFPQSNVGSSEPESPESEPESPEPKSPKPPKVCIAFDASKTLSRKKNQEFISKMEVFNMFTLTIKNNCDRYPAVDVIKLTVHPPTPEKSQIYLKGIETSWVDATTYTEINQGCNEDVEKLKQILETIKEKYHKKQPPITNFAARTFFKGLFPKVSTEMPKLI